MQQVEELRYTDEEADVVPVERIDDPLRRDGRQEHDPGTHVKRCQRVRDERQDVGKRKNRQNAVFRQPTELLGQSPNFVRKGRARQFNSFGIACCP